MKQFNILFSYQLSDYKKAKNEATLLLRELGDEAPIIAQTEVRGVAGVQTILDNRKVIGEIRQKYRINPERLRHAIKWIPVDNWCSAEIEVMQSEVEKLRQSISAAVRWAMQVDKHHYDKLHTAQLVELLSKPIDGKVDLAHPEKIIRVDILGNETGISLLTPEDIFSVAHP